jgi:hypothetical protein
MESILQASPQPTSEAVTLSPPSDTATEPPEQPDKCAIFADAMRESMVTIKREMLLFQERQEQWFRCRNGLTLSQGGASQTPGVFNAAQSLLVGQAMMTSGFDQIAFSTGLKIE